MVETMYEVARAAFAQIPPACRFQDADAQIIQAYREPLLALEAEMVKAFYDTVYDHQATHAIFVEGERAAREVTLSNWWRRTVLGPLDDEYFAWMAMVGLVHVARGVSNPMMLSMASFVTSFVADKVAGMRLERGHAEALIEAFQRLSSTVGSVISFGYDRAYDRAVVMALNDLAGMPESLFQRLRHQEVVSALAKARAGGTPAS
jgi:phytoene dehydrogenase-like protein